MPAAPKGCRTRCISRVVRFKEACVSQVQVSHRTSHTLYPPYSSNPTHTLLLTCYTHPKHTPLLTPYTPQQCKAPIGRLSYVDINCYLGLSALPGPTLPHSHLHEPPHQAVLEQIECVTGAGTALVRGKHLEAEPSTMIGIWCSTQYFIADGHDDSKGYAVTGPSRFYGLCCLMARIMVRLVLVYQPIFQ